MNLNDINPVDLSNRRRRRVGRGQGSGNGKTAGRGSKGQKARSGYSRSAAHEGGQLPLFRRIGKRGFNNAVFRTEYAIVNLSQLNDLEQDVIDPVVLTEARIVSKMKAGIKVLGDGDLSRAVTVRAHKFSKSARQKIEAAGGKVEVIS